MTDKVKREYKDTVFRMGMKIPENALAIYNALNGTAYSDVRMLEYNTLQNAIYMNVKNDVSFLIASSMNLYEHQSTYTPNMPLRDLMYVSDLYQKYIKDKTIYSSRLIKIPTPHFVVFYNGTVEQPEYMEQKISDCFEMPEKEPELELKVRIYNINLGMNESLKERCPFLKEYMIYVDKVRNYAEKMRLKEAVELAVDECIGEGVLREFLLKQKNEVVKMSIYEYDEEREMKLIRQDEREMGIQEGVMSGVLQSIRNIMINMNVVAQEAMRLLGVPQEEWDMYMKMLGK